MRELILIVDDEPAILLSLHHALQRDGYDLRLVNSAGDALAVLAREPVAVCVTDYRLPDADGVMLLERAREAGSQAAFILMSAYTDATLVARARGAGARHVLAKPFSIQKLRDTLGALLHEQAPRAADSAAGAAPSPLLGNSAAIRNIHAFLAQVGPSNASVLIEGESGTGKELIADALQRISPRARAPYVRVHCAAIPDTLLESELFGHERGAFTGAIRDKKGRFELADGGTIFLDEIGDMSPSAQMKLLRVLQSGEFDRVGGTRTMRVDVRVIAATNVGLQRAVMEKRFREDLYYRLCVIQVRVPPLRERREDVPLLVQHFIAKYARENRKEIRDAEPGALAVLCDYEWPGNVRELENAIERAVVLARGGQLAAADLPPEVLGSEARGSVTFTVGMSLAEIERRMIAETLRHTGGDKTRAARLLGITARTIYRKLQLRRAELEGVEIRPDRSARRARRTASKRPHRQLDAAERGDTITQRRAAEAAEAD